jgi:hypothetical protein
MAGWQALLAAGFPGAVALQIGLNLFVKNDRDLAGGRGELLAWSLGCVGLWLVLAAVLRWGGRLGKWLWAVPAGYAAFVLVREAVFPPAWGELNGSDPQASASAAYVALEAVTLLAAMALALLGRRIALPAASAMTLVFVAGAALTAARDADDLGLLPRQPLDLAARAGTNRDVTLALPAPVDKRPDIYHILFDEYQTVEHRFLRRQKGAAPFDDFICFADNVANYNHTWLSFSSFFTGTVYQPGQDIWGWFKAFPREGLVPTLKAHGYRVRLCGQSPAWYQTPYADVVRCSDEITAEQGRGQAGQLSTLLQLRLFPTPLAARLPASPRPSDGPQPADWPYFSMLLFREMVAGIRHTPRGNQYTFVHLILPHGPFVLDEHGRYLGTGNGTRLQALHLVDTLVAELVAELKRLDRYDDSILLIHADTGSYYEPDLAGQEVVENKSLRKVGHRMKGPDWQDGCRWAPAVVAARMDAAFLLKPAGQRGSRLETCPSQLLDVAPTLLGCANLRGPDPLYLHGRDLLHDPPPADRLRRTWVLGKKIGGVQVPRLQEYVIRHGQLEAAGILPVTGKGY